MSDGIVIQKTTAYLLVGFLLAILIGGYIVFGTASTPNRGQAGVSNNIIPQNPAGNVQSGAGSQPSGNGQPAGSNQQVQEVYIKALRNGGYDNEAVTVKAGAPVRIHFTTEGNIGCGSALVLYGLNQQTTSRNGQEGIIEFTPTTPGTYQYSCGMRMWGPGRFVVQ